MFASVHACGSCLEIARAAYIAEMDRERPRPRILIVDDDEVLLRAAHRTLRSELSVSTAIEPVVARHISVQQRPDVAIVDLVLRESSGIDLIAQLKTDRPELIVVAYSGHLTTDAAAAARLAGAAIVETKSLSLRDIVQLAVARAMEVDALEQFYQRLLALDETNLEPVFIDALRLLVESTRARLGYAELFDEEHRPRFWRGHHVEEQALEVIRTTISRGIVARAIAEGETIETRSAVDDARFADLDSVRTNEIGAVLCVPIRRDSATRGVLYLQAHSNSFSILDRRRAEACAAQIARVVQCGGSLTLEEEARALHHRRVREAMLRSNWNVSEAARELGVSRNFIYAVLGRRRSVLS